MLRTGKTALQRCMMLCCILVVSVTFRLLAQCSFVDNGHIFLHPYFSEGNWKAALYESSFIGSETMCEEKPLQLSFSKYTPDAAIVYTTADGKWIFGKAPLEDNDCSCCKPGIEYGSMQAITYPESITLKKDIPFVVMHRGEADAGNIVLVAAETDNSVQAILLNTSDGSIDSHEELAFERSDEQTVNGIWEDVGEDASAGVWIGGSNGLLYRIPFNGSSWENARKYTIDEGESVTSIGEGYLGTASGAVYTIGDGDCTRDSAVADDAIRFIRSGYAVGDNGTVIIKKQNKWRSFTSGDADYRYARLSACLKGTLIELLDKNWNYSADTLFDEKTTIDDISPNEVFEALNDEPFDFKGGEISIVLNDADGNYSLPEIIVRSGNTSVSILNEENVLSVNPAAVVIDGNTYFNDKKIQLSIDDKNVTVQFETKKSSDYTAVCGPNFWRWEELRFKKTESFAIGDTLTAVVGTDTLTIVNDAAMVTALRDKMFLDRPEPVQMKFNRLHFNAYSANSIRNIIVFDVSGRKIWHLHAGNHSQVSPVLPAGIYFVRIEYTDRKMVSHRIVSSGRCK